MAGQQQLRRGEYEQGNAGGLAGQEDVTDVYETTVPTGDGGVKQNRVEVRRHGREEKAAGLGGVAAGAYGLYEKHQGKKDPENATRHKIEEMVGGVGAVGAGGFAYHEHGEKKDGKKEGKELKKEGKHGLFK